MSTAGMDGSKFLLSNLRIYQAIFTKFSGLIEV